MCRSFLLGLSFFSPALWCTVKITLLQNRSECLWMGISFPFFGLIFLMNVSPSEVMLPSLTSTLMRSDGFTSLCQNWTWVLLIQLWFGLQIIPVPYSWRQIYLWQWHVKKKKNSHNASVNGQRAGLQMIKVYCWDVFQIYSYFMYFMVFMLVFRTAVTVESNVNISFYFSGLLGLLVRETILFSFLFLYFHVCNHVLFQSSIVAIF